MTRPTPTTKMSDAAMLSLTHIQKYFIIYARMDGECFTPIFTPNSSSSLKPS